MTAPRILITEDEIMVARDLEQRLQKLGYQVVDIVDTGEDAVQKTASVHPDLVLMDIRLRGEMDGIAAATQIYSAFKTPVIFLTAHADLSTLERAGSSEPFGYIIKPFQEKALHAAIEMAFYRHRAERRLHDMERWLATTLRSIGDAVIATDEAERITYLNPVAERLTGWSWRESVGAPFTTVFRAIHASDRQPIADPVQRTLCEGLVINLDGDTILVSKDGRERPIDDTVAPIRDDNDKTTGAVVVFRDATLRVQTEAELRRFNEMLCQRVLERTAELAAANRELETFSYSIAHDLRAPIRATLSFAQLLRERTESRLEEDESRLLNVITDSSKKMGEMIDGFLALAGTNRLSLNLKPVDMAVLVRDVVDALRANHPQADAHFEIGPLPGVIGDRVLLRQVWTNLLDNALKFSAARRPALITVDARQAEEGVVYCVRDNGVGFDMRYKDKLFGVFHRLHREDEFAGHGLGLASVQRIVHKHGGRVWAEAELGKGATFYFTLSRAPGDLQHTRDQVTRI
jgi:PAS domain S-box-containing protein